MQLSAQGHRALRLLLLQTWMQVITPEDDDALATMIGIPLDEWRKIKCSILPLLEMARLRIADTIKELRTYDGKRLPPSESLVPRAIIFERDAHACTYCGARNELQGDHIIPLSRGGTNAFNNLTTACKPCNQSKGSKTPEEWRR